MRTHDSRKAHAIIAAHPDCPKLPGAVQLAAHIRAKERTGVPKTADIIANALYEDGVRYAFGIPGGEVLELLEAFRKAGIKFVLTKQELGAGIMADATYQLTGK